MSTLDQSGIGNHLGDRFGLEGRDWQDHVKTAPFANYAINPYPAVVQFDHTLGDGKPQSHTLEAPGQGRLHLKESVEDTIVITLGNADTGIHHRDPNLVAFSLGGDLDSSLRRCELDCVGQQVRHHQTHQQEQ